MLRILSLVVKDVLFPTSRELDGSDVALVFPKHLKSFIQLAERFPHLKIVIDHGGKPEIKTNQFQPWAEHIKILATFPNVFCKLSGLLSEASVNASLAKLKPFIEHLFVSFGSNRLMWGSDYPVLNLFGSYENWFELCYQFIKSVDAKALDNVFGKTAADFYKLSVKETV